MKARKKRKFRKLYWLLVHLAVASVIFALLLYRPGRYKPLKVDYGREVCPYLTHEFMPQLHNGAERGEPFDMVVTQKGINQIVASELDWPHKSGEAEFSAPAVLFVPDNIVLMGTVTLKGVEFVVTIVLHPSLNQDGLLNLRPAKVKVGAMNLTIITRVIAKRMYRQRIATVPIDREDWGAKIAASLLNDEPFDPVFEVEDNKVSIKKVKIEQEKLTLRLAPASG